ncbi:site-specific integrase, partial [bacterium]|nr:site-specific integrase [bacterium]
MDQDDFLRYLDKEKKMAQNTLEAYKRDVMDFFVFAKETGVEEMTAVSNTDVVTYLLKMKADNKSAATVNRKLASIRAYFNFLQEKGKIMGNPTLGIKSPKIERKELEYLSLEEVDLLLQSMRGMRDSAILELLYATGIRVNEIISANVEDVNLRIGFFTCPGEHGKARIIPMGRPARKAVEEYIFDARDMLLKDKKSEGALFVNY